MLLRPPPRVSWMRIVFQVLNKTREAMRAKYEREREAESAEERARQEEAAEKDTKGKRKTTGKKRK